MLIKNRLKISGLILFCLAVVIVVTLVVSAMLMKRALENGRHTDQIAKGASELNTLAMAYAARPADRSEEQWQQRYTSLSRLLSRSRFTEAEEKEALRGMVRAHESLGRLFQTLTSTIRAAKDASGADERLRDQVVERLVSQLVARTQAMSRSAEYLTELNDKRIQWFQFVAFVSVFALLALLLATVVISFAHLYRSIMTPVSRLMEGTLALSRGDMSQVVEIVSLDEIGQLAKTFNEMTDKLAKSYVSINVLEAEVVERKRMEETLRQSEVKYRTVANNTYDWEFWTKPEGGFIYCSPSCEKLTGHSTEEFMQNPKLLRSTVHPEDLTMFDRHRQEEEEEVTPQEIQFRMIHKDGSLRWIGHVCQRVFDEEGKFLGIRGSNRDITKRKRVEEAFRESNERLRLAQRAAHVGVWDWDPHAQTINWTPELAMLYGLDPGAVRNYQDWTKLVHPEDLSRTESERDNAIAQHRPFDMQFRILHPTGETRWIHAMGGALYDQTGLPNRVYGINLDITDRKRAEELLRESEERFRAIFEGNTDGMLIADPESKAFVMGNPAICRMLGCRPEEIPAMRLADIHRKEDMAFVLDHFERLVSGTGSTGEDIPVRRKDGRIVFADITANPITLSGKTYVVGCFRDITERKQAEAALIESEERLRQANELLEAVTKGTNVIIAAQDIELHYTYFNTAYAAEIKQLTGKDIRVGSSLAELFADQPDQLAVAEREWREVLAGNMTSKRLEFGDPGRHRRVYSVLHTPIRDANGRVAGAGEVAYDITAQVLAEETLRVSEEKYRSLFESMTQGVVYQNAEGKVISANPAAETILGFTFEQMKDRTSGDPQWKSIHADGSDFSGDTHPTMTSLTTGNKTKNVIMGVYNPQLGENRWLKIDAVPQFRPGEDKPYQVYSLFDDITERRRAVEELKRSEEKFSALYSSMIEGVALHEVVYDGSGKAVDYTIIDVNPAYESITGLSRDKAIGKRASEVYGTKCPPYIGVYEKVASSRNPMSFESYFDPMKKHFSISVFSPAKGEFATVFADITERKQAEEVLQQRTLQLQHLTETLEERVKERTAELADLSSHLVSAQENERQRVSYDLHDNVWQMLVAIRFAIDNLFSGQEDWGALRDKSKQVMADIVGLVGKIRSMQGDLWPYVLDDIGLASTIDWYCREFGKNHSNLAIEMKNEIMDREIPSSAKIVIYRILQEALSNVVKHSQANHLGLRLVKQDHRMEFTVEDNGIGFDPEEAIAQKAPWGGLGLLSIKARTELSGGSFGIESSRGKGTTIRASWPL